MVSGKASLHTIGTLLKLEHKHLGWLQKKVFCEKIKLTHRRLQVTNPRRNSGKWTAQLGRFTSFLLLHYWIFFLPENTKVGGWCFRLMHFPI